MYTQMMYYGSKYLTSIISLTAANTRQRCIDILLVYGANQEAEE